jgi:hypothetical protein
MQQKSKQEGKLVVFSGESAHVIHIFFILQCCSWLVSIQLGFITLGYTISPQLRVNKMMFSTSTNCILYS